MSSAQGTIARGDPIDLSGAHLPGMDLSHTNLTRAKFAGANLASMNFQATNMSEADLRGANLSGANLTAVNLTRANLCDANLANATFNSTALDGADLTNANLSNARTEGVDFSAVKGLSWRQFLDSDFDESTVPPKYLSEEDVFQLLKEVEPTVDWQREFGGNLRGLLAELAKIRRSVPGRSLLEMILMGRISREMSEQNLP